MKYAEYDIRKAARFLNIKPKELKEIKDKNENMFKSLMVGAITLESGIEFGEALFLLRYRYKPPYNECMDTIRELEQQLSKVQKDVLAVSLSEKIA